MNYKDKNGKVLLNKLLDTKPDISSGFMQPGMEMLSWKSIIAKYGYDSLVAQGKEPTLAWTKLNKFNFIDNKY